MMKFRVAERMERMTWSFSHSELISTFLKDSARAVIDKLMSRVSYTFTIKGLSYFSNSFAHTNPCLYN